MNNDMKEKVYLEMDSDFIIEAAILFEEKCSKLLDKIETLRGCGNHSRANELSIKAEKWQELADDLTRIYNEKCND